MALLSDRTLAIWEVTTISLTFQLIPVIPVLLLPVAPINPATGVP